LIEAFKRYAIQKEEKENKRKTTLADIARNLSIRYETVRKKHALFKKYGADFLYALFDKKDKGILEKRSTNEILQGYLSLHLAEIRHSVLHPNYKPNEKVAEA